MGEVEKRLEELGLELPVPPTPMGSYVPAVTAGKLVFVSGQLPRRSDQILYQGKVDAEVSVDQAREAARLAALNAVAVLKAEIGELDRVKRVVKLVGSVASSPGFVDQPSIVNAASDLMVEVFGDAGRHARMAQGMAELPANACMGIELIVEISE